MNSDTRKRLEEIAGDKYFSIIGVYSKDAKWLVDELRAALKEIDRLTKSNHKPRVKGWKG